MTWWMNIHVFEPWFTHAWTLKFPVWCLTVSLSDVRSLQHSVLSKPQN